VSGAFPLLRRHRDLRLFLFGRFLSSISISMLTVATGWIVYDRTRSAMALGMAGLFQFLPAFLLGLPGGAVADRVDRRRLMVLALVADAVAALLLALAAASPGIPVALLIAPVVLVGAARAFLAPAMQSIVPRLVPDEDLPSAFALNGSVFQTATICGPALGGFLLLAGPSVPFEVAAMGLILSVVSLGLMRTSLLPPPPTGSRWEGVLDGWHFIRARPIVMGAISLDLFAVLLGGATALLPAVARDILHCGPQGLGLLRSASAVGAALTGLWLSRHPPRTRCGPLILGSVAAYGLCTAGFALSHSLALSVALLAAMGALDMVSVVIRSTLVQRQTPDSMRGRVSAVNMLFIGASNELGEFESGTTAAWMGVVPAILFGGIGSMAIALAWARIFPDLRRLDRLET
jgi:predicted MFS family arabinose efflux permease